MGFWQTSKKGKVLIRVVSLLIVQAFVFSSISFAAPAANPNKNSNGPAREVVTDPEKIVILRDVGLIKTKYTGKDAKRLIIHIQDAHCNFEAQTNITKILESLVKNDGVNLVSVEGADGFIDTSWFKAFPDEEVRKEVATYFMKKGEITGPEFLSITTDLPFKLFGAETRSYYIENLNAFTSSYPLKEDTEKYYNQIKAVLNKLKTYIYSEELKSLDSKIQDYESKKVQFTDYVKFLEGLAADHRINLRGYENLFKLVSVLIYEKKINFNVVDKERASLIDELTKKLDKEALAELVNRSLEFKTAKISSADYYDYLKKLAQHQGFSLSNDYPNLFNYIIYNSVYSRIENEKLFKDIKNLEIAIKEKLFANDDQRTLERLYRHAEILLGLVNIKLLNGDFDYYKEHKEGFSHEVFADFIKKMSARYGLVYDLDAPSDAVKESMPKLEDFYAIAIKRDKALVDNTLQAMKKEGAQVSVLVTGGFHSEGISRLLEGQGISYIVVCPNITKDVETPYIKILTNQRTPLEEILADTGAAEPKSTKQSMLAPYAISAAILLSPEDLKDITALVKAVNDRGLADRVQNFRTDWARTHVAMWIKRAEKFMGRQALPKDKETLLQAYTLAVNEAVDKGTISAGDKNIVLGLAKSAFEAILESRVTPAINGNDEKPATKGFPAGADAGIEENVRKAAKALGFTEEAVGIVLGKAINKEALLNDFAESVGIDKTVALRNMIATGLAVANVNDKNGYDLTPDFFSESKMRAFMDLQIPSSSNPEAVDLAILRLERIILSATNVGLFMAEFAKAAKLDQYNLGLTLGMDNAFQTLTAAWQLSNLKDNPARPAVAITAANIVNPNAGRFYASKGVGVEFSLPPEAKADSYRLGMLSGYQHVMEEDLARGQYNYRGTGTRQTVQEFFNSTFLSDNNPLKMKVYNEIREFIRNMFNEKEPLKAIITNGIGANDQFMWSLRDMYNANRPEGAPKWYHVTTARDLAELVNDKIKGENALFIDISRSGTTWEGVEVGIRSLALGFNKRIALANGGAVAEIAKKAAALAPEKYAWRNGQPLIIGMSPDIGGRNMHRKTTIYYTAQTVVGIFLPSMNSKVFAALNDKFDRANDFASPEESLPVNAGRFLHSSMNLFGAEHIVFATNTEPLRRIGTEWEQYVMEGCNKQNVITMGIHDMATEPEFVLSGFTNSPAAKRSVGIILLDKAAKDYKKDLKRAEELKKAMPAMIFTIDSSKGTLKNGGMSPEIQAAFDILWTDLVTVFTTFMRVDANSNPNVKLVRKYTADRVAQAKAATAAYKADEIGRGEAQVLVSMGNPVNPKIGTEGIQIALTPENAARMGKDFAIGISNDLNFTEVSRLNLFVGMEDIMPMVKHLRELTYESKFVSKFGWIPQTALFPLWSHKGLEANLSPLLAKKTVNLFFNSRYLDRRNPLFYQSFDNLGIMDAKYKGINGATIHETNDAMTMPNIKRMAEVSPTILFEFNEMTPEIQAMVESFYAAMLNELENAIAASGKPVVKSFPTGSEEVKLKAGEIDKVSNAPDIAELQVTIEKTKTLRATGVLKKLDDGVIITAYDTTITSTGTADVAKAAHDLIAQGLGNAVVQVRGSGEALLNAVREEIQRVKASGRTVLSVVTVAGDPTLSTITKDAAGNNIAVVEGLRSIGKVIAVSGVNSKSEKLYIPVAGLQDLALRVGISEIIYKNTAGEYDPEGIRWVYERLNSVALNIDKKPFTTDDVSNFLIKGFIALLPRIVPVNMAEAAEAYKAAQKTLASL